MTAFSASNALNTLSWDEVLAHLERDARLLVPVGSCEQFGPHLPIGASTVVAERLVDDLAREFGVLQAPTLYYGVNFPAERPYPGTAGLREKTLHRVLNELLAAWEDQGFEEFILITASDYPPHMESLASVSVDHARIRAVSALEADLAGFREGPTGFEHGGEVLTSLLLHLCPERVRVTQAHDFSTPPMSRHRRWAGLAPPLPANCPGAVGQPSLASAAKGARMYEHIREKIRTRIFGAAPAKRAAAPETPLSAAGTDQT